MFGVIIRWYSFEKFLARLVFLGQEALYDGDDVSNIWFHHNQAIQKTALDVLHKQVPRFDALRFLSVSFAGFGISHKP